MSVKNPFSLLSRGELGLWLASAAVTVAAFLLSRGDWLTLCACLVGVTALIFVAKGMPLGQGLTILFSLLYGVISFSQRYYGEMITYLGMTMPMAVLALVCWLRHPYGDTRQVEVARLTAGRLAFLALSAAAVTGGLYFVLKALGTACLPVSTLSVTTSFAACMLTYYRSPWYALAYAANDLVLIGLWVAAALKSPTSAPMVFCFAMFLVNDLYGFVSWRRMEKRQGAAVEKAA